MANTAPIRYLSLIPETRIGIWHYKATVAQVTANKIIIPAITGRQLVVTNAWMRAVGGNLSGPTTIALQESTTGGVVLSHVTADLTSGTWRLTAAGDGTVVTTKLNVPLVISEGLVLVDTGGTSAATATHIEVVVSAFYI